MKSGDRGTVAERWEAKVKRGPDCWAWTASKNTNGYGKLFVEGRLMGAHQVAWELFRGPIPEGMWVLHKCDNPPCVNPDHLFIGTQTDNMADCAKKGRNGMTRHPEKSVLRGSAIPRVRGSANGLAKLTEQQVADIRKEWSRTRKRGALAMKYGVTRPTIDKIVEGRSWKHVADADARSSR